MVLSRHDERSLARFCCRLGGASDGFGIPWQAARRSVRPYVPRQLRSQDPPLPVILEHQQDLQSEQRLHTSHAATERKTEGKEIAGLTS